LPIINDKSSKIMMKLKELGEEKAVSWIRELVSNSSSVDIPIGDDCAVMDVNGTKLVFTSDLIKDGSHIYPGMSAFQAGRKCVVVNLSDLASMGASPKGFLLSLGIDPEEDINRFKELLKGTESACREYGADFLGGDTNKSDTLVLSGFAFGECEHDVMTRRGAKVGDYVAMTGNLGASACGWQILTKNLSLDGFDEATRKGIEDKILSATLMPNARVKEGMQLAKSGVVRSCMDISDGLGISLYYMSDKCGFCIDEESLPVPEEVRAVCDKFDLDYEQIAYNVGEDFELLFTVDPNSWDELFKKMPTLSKIGEVTKKKQLVLKKKNGAERPLATRGYDHFTV
jgi:thiamine-monophosphate kinase